MRVSLEWLAEYVDLPASAHDLAEMLNGSGTAVEAVEEIGEGFEAFVVGRVLEVKAHPSADRLSLCRVDLGGEVADIVCGAPNVRPGMLSPVAPPGSRLPDGTRISEATIRGVASRGMLLSEKELGISEEADGIMVLEEGAKAGARLSDVLAARDTVLDLEITPNRPDCLSMLGIAREVAALTGQKVKSPEFALREEGAPAADAVRVDIEDGDLCSRYAARVIEEVGIHASPWWMRRRLQAAGVRPISNVVDVTNYVMLETGQPLHAFDLDLVKDGHIIVRRAANGEAMTTLDGVERRLARDDLLICDPSGPVALAGVMGGEHTEVSASTTRILLESAHFDPANIMRTARLQELPSEASYRFERGVDPGGCVRAADRAAFLMQELAGGTVRPGAVDARARIIEPVSLVLRVRRTAAIIGADIGGEEMASYLRSIELEAEMVKEDGGEDTIRVTVPTFRPDLEREIDLVEEVARLYGYGRIAPTLPRSSHNIGSLTPQQGKRREVARILAGMGLHEAICHAFISPRWLEILDPDRQCLPSAPVILRNPISEEMSVMRPLLLPGLLEAVRYNLNRQVAGLLFFEMGRTFVPRAREKLPEEAQKLGCALAARWLPKQWHRDAEDVDFFAAKGILERLMSSLRVTSWDLRREGFPFLHPAQSCAVSIRDRDVGFLGLVHPRVAAAADVPPNTAVLEIALDPLIAAALEPLPYEEIPRYPSIQMDLAVVVDGGVDAGEVEDVIWEAGGELLREVRLFDLYRGDQLGEGEKSLAFSLSFYALDRTLRDDEVRSVYEGIIAKLAGGLGARLR
ncbi:MAG: phenylalanine--tRNA ligase subunit beta [Actinomycetota bacterium]|nr:phenylalanine--tRNA ligase subunit beta [Actinomycetota bacterium]MDD5665834.1 phenylalanine--tRNA ligase subunit beta [Actinomycetota bacterium]